MARQLRVWVDHGRCVGNGTCLTIAPRVFAHNADRQSVAGDPAAETAETIMEAAENCPVSAIHVEDAETGDRAVPVAHATTRPPGPRSPCRRAP